MDIQTVNAQSRLGNVAAAIGRNPRSWSDWSCVMIDNTHLDEDDQQECLIWTKSIVDAYLKGVEGRVYFCETNGIHIICKGVRSEILHQTGLQICDLIAAESGQKVGYDFFNLFDDGIFYAQHVLEKISPHLTLTISTNNGLEDLIETAIGARRFGQRQASELTDKSSRDIKVMLVEDDPVTRWLVRSALKDHCVLACAPSGAKAFEMYQSFEPDIVFLDIGLPDHNGRSVLSWILAQNKDTYVVMFSGQNHLDTIVGSLEDGAYGFVSKPFLKEHLLHYINSVQS